MAADARALLVPPHSVEAEQSLLGSILLDSASTWPQVGASIVADAFYRPDHRLIFQAMYELAAAPHAIDMTTVADRLERQGRLGEAGGLAYLATLQRDTPTAINAPTYAAIVRDRAAQRALLLFARRLAAEVVSGTCTTQEMTSAAQEQLLQLQERARHGRGLVAASTLVGELLEDLDQRASGRRGLMIGLSDFDELTGGLDPGDLVVIAGRPAMGKTALLVTLASNVARGGQVAVFSAEMPSLQMMRRCLALASGISQRQLRRPEQLPEASWEKLTRSAPEIGSLRLFVDDTAQPFLQHVRAECAGLKARAGLALVLVDYLQLVRGVGRNRYEELREVAYGLKALAKDLAVPVIALAQLNRDVERRGDDKRPSIADLRDSGAIEEAADIVGMLFRESHYNTGFSMPHVLECNVVKHRNGELGQCLWSFAGEHSLATRLEEGEAHRYRQILAEQRRARRGGGNDL